MKWFNLLSRDGERRRKRGTDAGQTGRKRAAQRRSVSPSSAASRSTGSGGSARSRRKLAEGAGHERVRLTLDRLGVEMLEERYLLSTSVPVTSNWTFMGPAPILNGQTPGAEPVTGRIAAIAAHPTDANTIYVAAAGGGVWKTTDGGTSWTAKSDSQATLFMGALAVARSNPNIIYAGTGETSNSGLSFYGRGVLKSVDGGNTWTLLGNAQFDRRTISAIVINPTNPNTVYAAVGANGINGVNGNTGVWKSTDGGVTWNNTTTAISATQDYSDLVMDPSDPNVLYTAVGTSVGNAANGVYKTTNGGTSWSVAGNFPTGTNVGRTKIAISRTSPQTLYSSVVNPFTGALSQMLKTTDGGSNWSEIGRAHV